MKAAAASASAGSSGGGSFGGAEKCQVCSKSVYAAERVLAAGGVFHKTCFRCTSCRKGLDQGSVDQHEGQIYCPACHKREFGRFGDGGGVECYWLALSLESSSSKYPLSGIRNTWCLCRPQGYVRARVGRCRLDISCRHLTLVLDASTGFRGGTGGAMQDTQ